MNGILITFLIVVSITLWQHFGVIFDIEITPVWILELIYSYGYVAAKFLGSWFAVISSFIEYLKLSELFRSFLDVFVGVLNLCRLVADFFAGYIETVKHYEWSINTIVCGSLFLVSAIILFLCRFFPRMFEPITRFVKLVLIDNDRQTKKKGK